MMGAIGRRSDGVSADIIVSERRADGVGESWLQMVSPMLVSFVSRVRVKSGDRYGREE
jgi:hypothetical protein